MLFPELTYLHLSLQIIPYHTLTGFHFSNVFTYESSVTTVKTQCCNLSQQSHHKITPSFKKTLMPMAFSMLWNFNWNSESTLIPLPCITWGSEERTGTDFLQQRCLHTACYKPTQLIGDVQNKLIQIDLCKRKIRSFSYFFKNDAVLFWRPEISSSLSENN